MDEEYRVRAYQLLEALVRAIDQDDRQTLKELFDISDAVAEEIQEVVPKYFPDEGFSLAIAPFESAFSPAAFGRPNILLFEMNEKGLWGCECILWNKDQPGEPTLNVEFSGDAATLSLDYRYIGS